jgi:uncharacterized protein YfkK (UPF0435 family)
MSLVQILESLQTGALEVSKNLLLSIVKTVHDNFESRDEQHNSDLTCVKDMIQRLEDRQNSAMSAIQVKLAADIDANAAAHTKEIDMLAAALEKFTPSGDDGDPEASGR